MKTEKKRKLFPIPAACFWAALFAALPLCLLGVSFPVAADEQNYIENGDFSDPDNLAVWGAQLWDGAAITAEEADAAIYGDVTSYGKISDRTSNYHCFAQRTADWVENGREYEYRFYVCLDAEDYADAPADLRRVEISPYLTANGSTVYSQGVSGDVAKVLTPGEWTLFTGTYLPAWSGTLEDAGIRILEQGMNYGQGDGVMGTYYVTGVEIREKEASPVSIQTDVPSLKDAAGELLGDDFLVGTAIVNSELTDADLMALVTKHFNTLTLGNELKPDALFGYSNDVCPGTCETELNGETIIVPVLDYSRARRTLDVIYDWNQEHPDSPIRVRGHVLVWHSQTPEWFFHEDYDATKPYVSPEEMDKRQEWYIKTILTDFAGPDSKYQGMFYAWDVVNEAVSDRSGGGYRTDRENSSWWAVYQSNEFILSAFRYANKYADPAIDLYYNDYGDASDGKRNNIMTLLRDVKAAEGTRIDGFGMQGHYSANTGNPSAEQFEKAARVYAALVDKVMLTEWDLQASSQYDGTEEGLAAEYERQAARYQSFYEAIVRMRREGVNFVGMTFWGVVDKNSWLQTFSSVGGGADGAKRQCPLLFDDSYQVKPAYWVFADNARYENIGNEAEEAENGAAAGSGDTEGGNPGNTAAAGSGNTEDGGSGAGDGTQSSLPVLPFAIGGIALIGAAAAAAALSRRGKTGK